MVQPAHRRGHIVDVALVRGRQARSRRGQDRGGRVAQGLACSRAGEHDSHVLPRRAHGRAVHDVAPERIPGLHVRRAPGRVDQPVGHRLGPDPRDLLHGLAVSHRGRVRVHARAPAPAGPGAVGRGDPPHGQDQRYGQHAGEEHDERADHALRSGQRPLARQHVHGRGHVERPALQSAAAREGEQQQERRERHVQHRLRARPHAPAQVAHPVRLQFRIHHRYFRPPVSGPPSGARTSGR